MTDVLEVKVREEVGSHAAKRVRSAGNVPAVLYGHNQPTLHLAVPSEQVNAAIRHGTKMVELQGAVRDTALIREVQWDALGFEVLHFDLTRVSATETVQVVLPLELRGEAPGTKEGGVIEQQLHEVEIECAAAALPDKLEVNINNLHLEQVIRVADLVLPEGAKVLTDPDELVLHCVSTTSMADEEEEVGEVAEPELIGRREAEEETAE